MLRLCTLLLRLRPDHITRHYRGRQRAASWDEPVVMKAQMMITQMMSQSIKQSSVLSSIKTPTGTMVAGLHPWSDSLWGIGSGAMVGAVVTGGSLAAGGCCRWAKLWVWLRDVCEVNGDPSIHSAKVMQVSRV